MKNNMGITVIKDFVSKEYQNHLEKLIGDLPLFFNLNTVGYENSNSLKSTDLTVDCPQFTHVFIVNYGICSNYWSHIEPIIFNFLAKDGIVGSMKLFRCKLNLNPMAKHFSKENYFTPHVDVENAPGITAIYYVNDSDGDTLFFDKNMKIVDKVTPKKGTLVYFDNTLYHAGQPPKKSPFRAVINFNWVKE